MRHGRKWDRRRGMEARNRDRDSERDALGRRQGRPRLEACQRDAGGIDAALG